MEKYITVDHVTFPISWVTDAADVSAFLDIQDYEYAWNVSEEWMKATYTMIKGDEGKSKDKQGKSGGGK